MKKLFLSLVMMISSMVSFAQQEPGTFSIRPEIGFNTSSLIITTTDAWDLPIIGETNSKLGFVAGAEVEYQANNWFGISAGALYTQLGAKGATGKDITFKFDYVTVPIMANFYVWKGLCWKTGLQPAFKVNAKTTQGDVVAPNWSDDYISSFDIQIPVGVSYETHGFIIDARYLIGVGNVHKNDYSGKGRNSSTQITLGYKFHL